MKLFRIVGPYFQQFCFSLFSRIIFTRSRIKSFDSLQDLLDISGIDIFLQSLFYAITQNNQCIFFKDSSSQSSVQSRPIVQSFECLIKPEEDLIRICDVFYLTWQVNLADGPVFLKDCNCNVLRLQLIGHLNDGPYFIGIKKIYERYGISGQHIVEFRYNNSREFLIKVMDLTRNEIHYPDYNIPKSVSSSGCNLTFNSKPRRWSIQMNEGLLSGDFLMPIPDLICQNYLQH